MENAFPTQTPFPSSHINQILHVGSNPGYLSRFQVSLKLVEKCGSCGGSKFRPSHWLGHIAYTTACCYRTSHDTSHILVKGSHAASRKRVGLWVVPGTSIFANLESNWARFPLYLPLLPSPLPRHSFSPLTFPILYSPFLSLLSFLCLLSHFSPSLALHFPSSFLQGVPHPWSS